MASLTDEQRRRIEENRKKALAIRKTKLSTGTGSISSASTSYPSAVPSPAPNHCIGSYSGSAISTYSPCATSGAHVPMTIKSSSVTSYAIPNSSLIEKRSVPNPHNVPSLSNQSTSVKSSSTSSNFVASANSFPRSSRINSVNALPITVSGSDSSKPYNSNYNYKSSAQKSKTSAITFFGEPLAGTVTVSFSLTSRTRFNVDFPFNDVIVKVLKTIPGKLYDPLSTKWNFPLSSYNVCKNALQSIREFRVLIKPLPNFIVKVFIQNSRVNTDYKSIDLSKIESTLLSNLYPFQKEGVQFGISKNGRCIIADDMGLGKTIQALGIAHYFHNDWPLLIACPSSMKYQWEDEIRSNLPLIPVTRIFVLAKGKEQIHNPLVLITSYDLMARREEQLKTIKFGVIIIDESHSLKNLKANRTKTALTLISKAKRCILLSGTPALSRPYELYPQIKALESNAFSGKEFGLRYCDGKETRFGWDYSGSSNMDELKILLEERFMIRRLKSHVLDQLPSKVRQVVILDKDSVKAETKVMNEYARKLGDENLKGMEKRGTLLSYFAETGKIKLKAVKNYICEILETGNKFLVFAHHKIVLDEISRLLEEKETFYIRIDGAVSSDERKSVCDQFQYEDKYRVAVLSITAASTGLTLTAANLVIFAELFWNPGILTQAEDRVHRIGQQDSVLVQYLLATGTADDHLWLLVKSKLDTLNQAGLSKDTFACERTSVVSKNPTIDEYFDGIQDCDADLSQLLDELEGSESKRIKLAE